jgi:FkbM family methyltransferase
MTILIHHAIRTYQREGVVSLIKRTFRYLTNFRQLFGDISWFVRGSIVKESPVAMVNGMQMYLISRDPSLSRELSIYGVHEPASTTLLKGFIHMGMTALDIGANIGYYALLQSRLVGECGKVLAIEPALPNYELLLRNIELNHVKNITIFPRCAIGDADSTAKLYLGGAGNWHSLTVNPDNISSYVEVPLRKLDSLLSELAPEPIDFIRMDIEGYELQAIKGMRNTLEKFKPRMMIELHYDLAGSAGINEMLLSLDALGYRVAYILDRDQDWPCLRQPEIRQNISIHELTTEIPRYRVAMIFLTVDR